MELNSIETIKSISFGIDSKVNSVDYRLNHLQILPNPTAKAEVVMIKDNLLLQLLFHI